MADENNGAAPAAADTTPAPAPVAVPASISAREAVGLLGKMQEKPATATEAGAAETESPSQEEDAGPEAVPGETNGNDDDPAAEPSIEAPRSWSKEHKDAFKSLPAHLQQMVAESERAREADFLRRQNDAAEKSKAAEAKEQAAEQARQQYEQALPNLLQAIQAQVAGEFSDIRSWEDVQALAANDPVRYMQWDASQKRLTAVQQEAERVAGQQAQQLQKQWGDFVAGEDKNFLAKVPEMSDPQKAAKLTNDAKSVLTDLGFNDDELGDMWNGRKGVSLRDHRVQLLILDAVRLRTAKAQLAKPSPKPVTPTQRPGTASSRGEAVAEDIKAQRAKLERSGDPRDAVKLLGMARKRA